MLVFALALAVCGFFSAMMCGLQREGNPLLAVSAGVPFAIATGCVRAVAGQSPWAAAVAIPLWPFTFFLASGLSLGISTYAAVSVAGFIGSISVALIHSVGSKVTNIGTELLAISLAGAISALPFGTLASMRQYDARHALFSIAGFVAWEVAVGTTLYWFTYRNAMSDAPSGLR